MKNIIEIRNLSKTFHSGPVLQNINIDIKLGEFLTILGPSGCGKTTLLRLISGFEQPSSGELIINGINVSGVLPSQRDVHTVFQNYALFPHMTVFDNVAFGLRCKKRPEKEISERVNQALEMVKLLHLAKRKPHALSGGQQQRVAIARAAVNKPLVLLLDEPLSALDHNLRKSMQVELKILQRQLGITFVLVTHDQEEALSMSDRVVVMNHGIIEQVGTPREVYEQPTNLYVANFIGEANLFDFDIVKIDEENITVKIEERLFTLKKNHDMDMSQKYCMLIRPEDLRTWDTSETTQEERDRMIPAVVEEVIYKGCTVDLILRTDHQKRLATTEFFNEDDENLDYKIGERVWLEWTIGWEVLLPA